MLPISKPPPGTPLNRTHPMASGLIASFDFREGDGLVTRDDVAGYIGTLTSGPIWKGGVKGGKSLLLSGSASVQAPAPDAKFLVTGALTLFAFININTVSTFHSVLYKSTSNGGVDNPFDFRTDNSSTPHLSLTRAGASGVGFSTWAGTGTIPSNLWTSVGVVCSTGMMGLTDPKFYINGNFDSRPGPTGTAGNSTVVTGANYPLQIGRRQDGAVQLLGNIDCVRIYNRPLPSWQMNWLHAQPFAMYGQERSIRWFIPAASAGVKFRRNLMMRSGSRGSEAA